MALAPTWALLLLAGLIVGGIAVVALLVGVEPASLPPFLVKVALYKLAFIAVGGLLVAGAIVGRRARRSSSDRPAVEYHDRR